MIIWYMYNATVNDSVESSYCTNGFVLLRQLLVQQLFSPALKQELLVREGLEVVTCCYLSSLQRLGKEYLFVTRNIGLSPSNEEDKIYM